MSMKIERKRDTEKWEDRQLGASEKHATPSPSSENEAVDNALGLQLISIRLQSNLIEDLKALAKQEGLAYQPLMRMILTRYVNENKSKPSSR